MQEDLRPRTLLGSATASQEVAPAWMISDVNTDRAIQTLSSTLGRAAVDVEAAQELQTALAGGRAKLDPLAESDSDSVYSEERAEDEEEQRRGAKARTRSRSSNEPQDVPSFPRRFAEDVPQECLPGDATSPQNSSIWTISAPEIEQAIRRLYAKCGRAPTELEIAAELGTDLQLYRETLSHLKDLEIGVLYAESNPGASDEWLAYSPDGDGDVLFRCLRSEMQVLFRNAICSLNRMERIVIMLTHFDSLYSKTLSVILELPESEISGIRSSAILRLRASLPNPLLRAYPRMRGLSQPANTISEDTHGSARVGDDADVTVYGEQTRLLSSGQPWGYLGDRASWSRDFTSWYSLDDEQRLTQIGRKEHYHLKLDL